MSTTTKKIRKNVDVIVGRLGEEYYSLDRVFDDGKYRGAVGTIFRPISKAEEMQAMDPNYSETQSQLEDHYHMSMKMRGFEYDGQDTKGDKETGAWARPSISKWLEEHLAVEGLSAVYDLSYSRMGEKVAQLYNSELLPKNRKKYNLAEFSDCRGGGRCFHVFKDPKTGEKYVSPSFNGTPFDKIYDQDAIDEIMEYEKCGRLPKMT